MALKKDFFDKSYIYFGISTLISLFYFFYIYAFGINCPLFDEFDYLKLIQQYTKHEISFASILLDGHNEHLMGVSNVIMAAFDFLFGFNFKMTMFASGILQMCSTILMIAILKKTVFKNHFKNWYSPIMLIIMLSPSPVQNIFYSFNIAWFIVTFFGLISMYCITLVQWNNPLDGKESCLIFLSALFSFLAAMSSAPGLFFIIASSIIILYENMLSKCSDIIKNKKLMLAFFSFIASICSLIVIYKYSTVVKVTNGSVNLASLLKSWILVLSTISGSSNPIFSFFIGGSVLILALLSLYQIRASNYLSIYGAPFAMIIFGLFFSIGIAFGRTNLGEFAALEDRYAAYVLIMMCGIFAVAFSDTAQGVLKNVLKYFFITILVISTITGLKHAFEYGIYVREERSIASMIFANPYEYSDFQINKLLYYDSEVVRKTSDFFASHAYWKFKNLTGPLIEDHALPYSKMPDEFLKQKILNPSAASAIDNLWQVYVACADLRDAFPVRSTNFYESLLKWTVNAINTGGHHADSQLVIFRDDYAFLLSHLEALDRNQEAHARD